ncbi:trypsin, alkaline A-like [Vanessa atalanta]|uniref:trypsin, alkaline A-like n=1 Tax=Vanessa atalanta TaxID=42275 RepID=UPI001FCD1686|nr:trypsin, alkaline A-like [Vanessa atalanta]
MRAAFILALGLAVAVASTSAKRIIGGSVTSIDRYPFAAAMLRSPSGTGTFWQACGASILNNRAVLTAAHCFNLHPSNNQWRIRVGSTNANSGGVVFTSNRIINHPSYNRVTADYDVAVVRINGAFSFNNNVRAGRIAGANYHLADNQVVWAIGWGLVNLNGPASEQLRHVQVWTINQEICRSRYARIGRVVTNSMLCSGWLDVGGRDQCQGDSGGPLLHNDVIVGVCSWGEQCALPFYPGVNGRVSQFSSWIEFNA